MKKHERQKIHFISTDMMKFRPRLKFDIWVWADLAEI